MKTTSLSNFIILFCVGIVSTNCSDPFYEVTPPPQTCSWERTTDYCLFSTYLQIPSSCVYFDVADLNVPLISLSHFFDAVEQESELEGELVWQSIGNTCTEATMNGPKLVMTNASQLSDGGCDGFMWYVTPDVTSSYIEHELTLKIENVRDQNTGQYGTLLWRKLFCQTDFDNHTAELDCVGQFLPYDGERQIYVHNMFTNF